MNERWTMNMNYERTDERSNDRTNERSNDRMNERSKFRQHNGWIKIIWTKERTNNRTNKPWTIGRTIGRTNEQTKNRWTNDQMNDRTILVLVVCLCGTWSGRVGGRVAMKWLGVAWEEALAPLFMARWGIRGRMRGLVGDKHVLVVYKWN
jgi:hypothetical protein